MPTRPRRFALALTLTLVCTPLFAHVRGDRGRAPDLPDNVPGIDRPFPQDAEKFTFAIIGDKTGGGLRNWPIFDRAMDEVSRLRPDFAIMVGDLIQGYTEDMDTVATQWDEFYGHAERMEVPFFFLPGNHDITNNAMYNYWEENVGRTYYSFVYAGCHFILLNTEEGWRAEGGTSFGPDQMAWLQDTIAARRDAKHTFVFMHRPAWYSGGTAGEYWETIEGWLAGLPYTVFAGHFHRLSYEMRDDRPYYVLSATGGGLGPSQVLEYGSFHHYTTVTVDGDDVAIALIEPFSVHPHDIAPREFREQANRALSWTTDLPMAADVGGGVARATLTNTLDAPVEAHIEVTPSPDSAWTANPVEVRLRARPGETADQTFDLSYDFAALLPLPTYRYTLKYAGTTMREGSGQIAPGLTHIPEWTLAGPYDLGVDTDPNDDDIEAAIPAFANPLGPEDDSDASIEWVSSDADEWGRINLGAQFGAGAKVAYGRAYIHSPDARQVLAAVQCDDMVKILVGESEAVGHIGYRRDPEYITLSLEEGWNRVLVKCGDWGGNWGFALRVADGDDKLRFSAQP